VACWREVLKKVMVNDTSCVCVFACVYVCVCVCCVYVCMCCVCMCMCGSRLLRSVARPWNHRNSRAPVSLSMQTTWAGTVSSIDRKR